MLQFLLDTDHLTLYDQGHPRLTQRLAMYPKNTIAVSVVTVEESLRGRLGALSRSLDGPTRIRRCAELVGTVQLFCQLPLVHFDQASENHFQQLRALRLRIGTQDLKIAAVALASQLTLLTRNRRDFGRIPGLVLDDWSS
jgi:tRNA(fMet)-specific endonuclease VapC